MEYTEELYLIQTTSSQDSIGNIVQTETRIKTFARPNVVGTREFYNAMQVGIRPNAELQIRTLNYSGEEEVEYKGKRLAVIRTIPKGKFDTVLVVGEKSGVNG